MGYCKEIELDHLEMLIKILRNLINSKVDIKEVINVEEFKKKVKETIDYVLD